MTAEELIEELEKLPPDTRILAKGYEGGYADVWSPGEPYTYCLNVNDEWYYGDHAEQDSYDCRRARDDIDKYGNDPETECDHDKVQAVVL